jgi:hypothetical protein
MEVFPLTSSVSQASTIRYRIHLYQCLPPSLPTSTIHPSSSSCLLVLHWFSIPLSHYHIIPPINPLPELASMPSTRCSGSLLHPSSPTLPPFPPLYVVVCTIPLSWRGVVFFHRLGSRPTTTSKSKLPPPLYPPTTPTRQTDDQGHCNRHGLRPDDASIFGHECVDILVRATIEPRASILFVLQSYLHRLPHPVRLGHLLRLALYYASRLPLPFEKTSLEASSCLRFASS